VFFDETRRLLALLLSTLANKLWINQVYLCFCSELLSGFAAQTEDFSLLVRVAQ